MDFLICRSTLVIVLSLLFIVRASAQTPVIQLTNLTPSGGTIGAEVAIQATGSVTDETDRLYFSHPGIVASVQKETPLFAGLPDRIRYGSFSVRIGTDVAPGIYEAWAVGRMGASNSRPFLVTKEPQRWAQTNHLSLSEAQPLELSVWTHAKFQAKQRNYYRFRAEAGETCIFYCMADRLDSRAIPYLVLRDANGQILVQERATQRRTLRIKQTFAKSGDYSLVMNDFLFRGGEDFHYCIVRMGQDQGVEDWAWVDGMPSVGASGYQRWLDGSVPLLKESESQVEQPIQVKVPVVVDGRWDRRGDIDAFEFEAKKGEAIYCDVLSESLGKGTDPRILIEKITEENGTIKKERLVVQDDQPNVGGPAMSFGVRDPRLVLNVPSDGKYRLTLQDLQSDSREEASKPYLLRMSDRSPSFDAVAYFPNPNNTPLLSKALGSMLSRGGALSVRVVVRRERGMDGAIEIRWDSPPMGIECKPAMIAAGQTETELVIVASEEAPSWFGRIDLTATYRAQDQEWSIPVQAATFLLDGTADRGPPLGRLSHALYLVVSNLDVAPLLVQVGDGDFQEVVQGAKVEWPIKVVRRQGGEGKCQLRPQNLPPKATMGEVSLEGNVKEGKAELQVHAETPPGDYTFWMVNETKVKVKKNPQALARKEEELKEIAALLGRNDLSSEEKTQLAEIEKKAKQQMESLKGEVGDKEYAVFWPTTPLRVRVKGK